MKLMSMLPFLESEDLKELIEKIRNKEITGVKYTQLYPFLNAKEVDELVDLLVEEGNPREIYSALPFMSDERLSKLHKEIKEGKVEGFKEEALLPFLGTDKIKELVQNLIKNSVESKLDGLDEEISDKIEKVVKNAFDK